MTTRTDVVRKAMSYDGYQDGVGYPGPGNVFEHEVGAPVEYWCGVFITAIFKMVNLPLPSMQVGMPSGFAYVPSADIIARARNAWETSWLARPADIIVVSTEEGPDGHVELVTRHDTGAAMLYSIGGDSGPTNIPNNRFHGEGGVHQHQWYVPFGIGNPKITGVIDTGKFVRFGTAPTQTTGGVVDVNMPVIVKGQSGKVVSQLQRLLNGNGARLTVDGVYGPATNAAVQAFQKAHGVTPAEHWGHNSWTAAAYGHYSA